MKVLLVNDKVVKIKKEYYEIVEKELQGILPYFAEIETVDGNFILSSDIVTVLVD